MKVLVCVGIYLFGALLAIVFLAMRLLKRIKVWHRERFPHFEGNIIFVANHPSWIDPWLVAVLCAKGYLTNPFKLAPIIVADKKNFCESRWWKWMSPIMIAVDRDNKHSAATAFLRMREALKSERNIIIFPEGGRTFRGTEFTTSPKGNRIRILTGGTALLVKKTEATVVPIWIDGSDNFYSNSTEKGFFRKFNLTKRIFVKIGNRLHFHKSATREEIIQVISNSLLSLADETL
jgi:1-acyl-sn-glycerol-3-phosphate acyltransferase